MVFLIVNWLHDTFALKIPTVFYYYSTRMVLAAVTALLLTIFLGPWFIRKLYELRIGQHIRKEDCPLLGELHARKQNTPTMGGILILFSMLSSMFLWMQLTHTFTLILFFTTVCIGGVGAYDDFLKLKYSDTKGLSAKKKLLVQFLVSAVIVVYFLVPSIQEGMPGEDFFMPPVVKEQKINEPIPTKHVMKSLTVKEYASRLYVPFIKKPILQVTTTIGLIFLGFFMMLVIVGSSNAVNLTDGLDGLATGCLIMVAAGLAVVAFVANNLELARYLRILYIEGSGEIAIYLCAFMGACLGFLWYNGSPAQVFMGDTGSLTLGAIVGVSAVLLRREFLLGIIGGVFVVEALSVILQVASYKLRNKKRIFLCAPLHHHFEYKGLAETKVVIRFWIIALLLALIGIGSLKFQ